MLIISQQRQKRDFQKRTATYLLLKSASDFSDSHLCMVFSLYKIQVNHRFTHRGRCITFPLPQTLFYLFNARIMTDGFLIWFFFSCSCQTTDRGFAADHWVFVEKPPPWPKSLHLLQHILLSILSGLGLTGGALSWLKRYLSGPSFRFFVARSAFRSSPALHKDLAGAAALCHIHLLTWFFTTAMQTTPGCTCQINLQSQTRSQAAPHVSPCTGSW